LPLDPIADELGMNLDPFDLICHIAFDKKPLTPPSRSALKGKADEVFGGSRGRYWTRSGH
jgi:type I restriction enzyme R subunit